MLEQKNRKAIPWACIVPLAVVVGLTACGGGGSSSTTTTDSTVTIAASTAQDFVVPAELSAVPTSGGSSSSSAIPVARMMKALSFPRALTTSSGYQTADELVAAVPGSDYETTTTRKFVEMDALNVFNTVESVMKALKQTSYWDKVGAGKYRAVVSFDDGGQKQVMTWTVEVTVEENANGTTDSADGKKKALIVKAWIDDGERAILAKFSIYQGAVIADDGTVTNLGRWRMDVAFNADGTEFFVAEADTEGGLPVLKVNSRENHDHLEVRQGVLHRNPADGSGYGKINVTTHENTSDVQREIGYAYNTNYITYHSDTPNVTKTFDRNTKAELTWRYGLFNATTGADVRHTLKFGFPVKVGSNFGYYGAWRGEHHLWAFGQGGYAATDGMSVTKEDWSTGQKVETPFTVRFIPSVLNKRELQTSSLAAIKGDVMTSFFQRNWELTRVGGAWKQCFGFPNFDTNPAVCKKPDGSTVNGPGADGNGFATFADTAILDAAAADLNGNIAFFLNGSLAPGVNYSNGSFSKTVGNFSDGDHLSVHARGQLRFKLTNDTTVAWIKVNNDGTDGSAFAFPTGGDMFINSNGESYVIKHRPDAGTGALTDPASYSVLLQVMSTINPTNKTSFIPTGTSYLASPWNRQNVSSHLTVDLAGVATGMEMKDHNSATYTGNEWTLFAWSNGPDQTAGTADDYPLRADGAAAAVDNFGNPAFYAADVSTLAVQFGYRYSAPTAQNGPAQVYLIGADTTAEILDDPIKLVSVPLADSTSAVIDVNNDTVADETRDLRYDGFMQGLPDMHEVFKDNGFDSNAVTKIRNVATGTRACTGASFTGTCYFVKQLETGVFLNEDTSGTHNVDLGPANGIVLSTTLPVYVPTGMTTLSTTETDALAVEVTEGKTVD